VCAARMSRYPGRGNARGRDQGESLEVCGTCTALINRFEVSDDCYTSPGDWRSDSKTQEGPRSGEEVLLRCGPRDPVEARLQRPVRAGQIPTLQDSVRCELVSIAFLRCIHRWDFGNLRAGVVGPFVRFRNARARLVGHLRPFGLKRHPDLLLDYGRTLPLHLGKQTRSTPSPRTQRPPGMSPAVSANQNGASRLRRGVGSFPRRLDRRHPGLPCPIDSSATRSAIPPWRSLHRRSPGRSQGPETAHPRPGRPRG
jgi:hypothetical protein